MKPLLLTLLAGSIAFAQPAPGNDTILSEHLKADVYFLAGDPMRGRLTATNEYAIAAEWIEARFKRLGLKPAGGRNTYFHRFDLVLARLADGNALSITTLSAGARREAALREDFYPMIFSANAMAEGEVVFAGYGIRAPNLQWEDYPRDGLRGKIALILDGDPGADDPKSPFDGVVSSEYGNPLRKTMAAQENGAIGVLFVSAGEGAGLRDSFPASARTIWPDKPPHLERYTLATYAQRIQIPAAQISPALAELLMQQSGVFKTLVSRAAKPFPQPMATGARAKLNVALARQIVPDRTVVAMLEGSDPVWKDEAVIVSSHYDHNGATAEQIFNGADDNASGAAGMLEIAEAYAHAGAQGRGPKRSVLFVSWGSEERCCGPLLGSWAWVEHPAWPLDKTVAVLNMDMIGRNEEVPENGGPRFKGLKPQAAASNANSVNIIGYSYSPDLSKVVDEANRGIDLRLLRRYDNNSSNLLRRSDQWPFLQRGVPALFFHTGLHPDYHTMNDRPERIDYKKMERITRLVHQASWALANQTARPRTLENRVIPQDEQER
jgi:hypothetical protein